MRKLFILLITSIAFLNAQQPIGLQEAYQKAMDSNPEVKSLNLRSEYVKSLENTVYDIDPFSASFDLGQTASSYVDNGFSLGQTFKFPGFYEAQKQVMVEVWKQSVMNGDLKKYEMKQEIAKAFNQLLYLNEKEKLIQLADSIYSEYYRLASLKVQKGESPILEQNTAENYRAQAEIQLSNLNYDRNLALYQFNYWIADGKLYTAKAIDFYAVKPAAEINSCQLNQIYLQSLQQESEISKARMAAQKAKKKPSFTLEFNNTTMYGNGADNKFYDYSHRFSSGLVGISVPIFNKGINANIESEKINQQLAESNVSVQQRKLESQLETLKNTIQKMMKEQEYYKNAVLPNADSTLNTANQLYSEGTLNYLEWVILVNQSLETKNTYIENQKKLNDTIIQFDILQDENEL